MLLANSFLLIATAYATNDPAKNINANPANAKQNIQEIILSNWELKKICTILLFDKSWSMFFWEWDQATTVQKNENGLIAWRKRNNAVSWTIEYSELFINQNSWAKIWLILFGNDAQYTHTLSNQPFTNEDFSIPNEQEWTRLDLWIEKARDWFRNADDCTIKNIIIISDWAPKGSGLNETLAAKKAFTQTLSGELEWINFYSIGYEVETFGRDVLRWISAGWFYDTENTTIETIFKKMNDDQRNSTTLKLGDNKLKIKTENFIISMLSGSNENNEISINSKDSNILWWKWNKITAWGQSSTIIAWNKNSIQSSQNSTILWWKENQIIQWTPTETMIWWRSAILWWSKNKIKLWNYSTIWWWSWNDIENGNYSTIIWNNNTINWDNSVAMGFWTKNQWNNSFYWTDNTHNNQLNKSNVFAVISDKWMAINTDTPNPKAQLTISWNLAIKPNTNDENIVCWNWNWKWIIKAIKKNNNEECLCSCDWNERKSLHNWVCKWLCNNEVVTCWTTVSFSANTYHWTCEKWEVIKNSYYVNNDNIVHRACQWNDWSVVICTWNSQ